MLAILLQMAPAPWRFSMVKDERTSCPALLDYLLASGLHTLVEGTLEQETPGSIDDLDPDKDFHTQRKTGRIQ